MEKSKDSFEVLNAKAEELVKSCISGARKGLPDVPNYIHSFRVRDLVKHYLQDDTAQDVLLAALLHDVVEDGDVSWDELRRMGFSPRTIELVSLSTHRMDISDSTQRWMFMVSRLIEANDADAWRIKLADLADNILESQNLSPAGYHFMVKAKAPIFLRLAKVDRSAYDLLKERMEMQLKRMEQA